MLQRVLAILITLAIAESAGGPAFAEAPPSVRVATRTQVFARPSADAPVVSALDTGAVLDVIDSDGQWYLVALAPDARGARPRGWVRAADVGSAAAADAPEEALQSPAPPASKPPAITIPPSMAEVRAANARREAQAAEAARIEQARQEMEQRQREYDDLAHGRPIAAGDRPAPAQSRLPARTQYDIFGGYSLLWDTTDGVNFPLGWVAAVGGRLTDAVAIVGEVEGSYKTAGVLGVNLASANTHSFAGGPRFSALRGTRTVFVQVLGGVAVTRVSVVGIGLPSSTGVAVLPGFGAELPVTGRLAVRMTGELGLERSSYGWSNGFRLVSGVVMRRSAGR
jgi:hypothetical protein